MTQPVDVAYVDIVARTKQFRRELKDTIEDEVRDLERGIDDALDEIDKHFANTAKEVDKVFKEINDTVKDTATVIETEIGDAVTKIDLDTDGLRRTVGSNFDKMFLHAAQNGQFVERRVVPIWKQAMDAIGGTVTSAATSATNALNGLFSSIGTGPFIISALVIAIPPLIAILVALGAAVADLTGLLALIPGVLTVLAATLAPLIIGFQNFGDAVSAVLSGADGEELDAALSKLAPAARSVAKEFALIAEPFRQLQRIVQQALFKELVGDLTRLTNVIIGPLTSGLALVANSLSQIISAFFDILTSAEGVNFINEVFTSTNDILQTLGPAIVRIFGAFLKLIVASLPTIELLAGKFAELLTKFADFLVRSIEDGSFQAFMDDALATLKAIVQLGGAIIAFFGALFTQETADAGRLILTTLRDIFIVMTEFLQSEDGKTFLADLITLSIVAIRVLGGVLLFFSALIAGIISGIVIVLDFFGIVDRGMHEVAQTSVNAGNTIVDAISSVPARLMAFAGHFVSAGKHLINSFIGGFRQSGNFISDVAGDIVRGVRGGLNRFIGSINSGIAQLDALLPFSLSRIPFLASGGIVGAQPGGVLARVAEGGQDEVVAPLSDLKAIIADAVGQGGESIVFEPGAINVNFSGVTPTASEARTVGQAVGDGIISTLTRRNIRAQVRAI